MEAMRKIRSGEGDTIPRTERDTPINIVLIGTLAMSVPILIVFLSVIDQDALLVSGGQYAGIIAFSVLFSLIAGFVFHPLPDIWPGL